MYVLSLSSSYISIQRYVHTFGKTTRPMSDWNGCVTTENIFNFLFHIIRTAFPTVQVLFPSSGFHQIARFTRFRLWKDSMVRCTTQHRHMHIILKHTNGNCHFRERNRESIDPRIVELKELNLLKKIEVSSRAWWWLWRWRGWLCKIFPLFTFYFLYIKTLPDLQ